MNSTTPTDQHPAERPMTWMCEHGHHGTAERHTEFTYHGRCAGTVRSLDGSSWACPCSCHTHVPAPQPCHDARDLSRAAECFGAVDLFYVSLSNETPRTQWLCQEHGRNLTRVPR